MTSQKPLSWWASYSETCHVSQWEIYSTIRLIVIVYCMQWNWWSFAIKPWSGLQLFALMDKNMTIDLLFLDRINVVTDIPMKPVGPSVTDFQNQFDRH